MGGECDGSEVDVNTDADAGRLWRRVRREMGLYDASVRAAVDVDVDMEAPGAHAVDSDEDAWAC